MSDGIQLLFNGLVAGAVYGLVAISFALIYNTTRFFHFAHGAIYTLAAYIAYSLISVRIASPFAVLGAVTAVACIGVLTELIVYKPLRARHASSIVLLIASLGLLITLQNLVSLLYGSATRPLRNVVTQEGVNLFGARVTTIQLTILVVCFSLNLSVALVLNYTRAGMILRAVANNQELARIVGVNNQRTILLAFFLGSALAGVAAVLTAHDSGISPVMGFSALLYGVVAMIIGGIGNVQGNFLGGIIIGLIQQSGAWFVSSKWQDAIVFLILIAFLLLRPQGLFGKPVRKVTV
jgi:branched-chain amino acid transport system permease protein